MLGSYLSESIELRKMIGTDGRGQSVFESPCVIKCRKQTKMNTIRDSTSSVNVATDVYYTKIEVRSGDMIDGKIIMGVSVWTDILGNIIGYKAVI